MAKRKPPTFNYDLCVACGICVTACPVSALSLSLWNLDKWNKAFPALNGRTCITCGMCAKECPMGAIVCEETPNPPKAVSDDQS